KRTDGSTFTLNEGEYIDGDGVIGKMNYITKTNGRLVMMNNGSLTPVENDITMTTGTIVMKDGTVKNKDGKTKEITEGEWVSLDIPAGNSEYVNKNQRKN